MVGDVQGSFGARESFLSTAATRLTTRNHMRSPIPTTFGLPAPITSYGIMSDLHKGRGRPPSTPQIESDPGEQRLPGKPPGKSARTLVAQINRTLKVWRSVTGSASAPYLPEGG